MTEYRIRFPREEEVEVVTQVRSIIQAYAEVGLMMGQSVDFFLELAAQNFLAVAVDDGGLVIGCAALTQKLPLTGAYEFGAWAVIPEAKGTGLGKQLYQSLFKHVAENPLVTTVIAYANKNSGPVLKKNGWRRT